MLICRADHALALRAVEPAWLARLGDVELVLGALLRVEHQARAAVVRLPLAVGHRADDLRVVEPVRRHLVAEVAGLEAERILARHGQHRHDVLRADAHPVARHHDGLAARSTRDRSC